MIFRNMDYENALNILQDIQRIFFVRGRGLEIYDFCTGYRYFLPSIQKISD